MAAAGVREDGRVAASSRMMTESIEQSMQSERTERSGVGWGESVWRSVAREQLYDEEVALSGGDAVNVSVSEWAALIDRWIVRVWCVACSA